MMHWSEDSFSVAVALRAAAIPLLETVRATASVSSKCGDISLEKLGPWLNRLEQRTHIFRRAILMELRALVLACIFIHLRFWLQRHVGLSRPAPATVSTIVTACPCT